MKKRWVFLLILAVVAGLGALVYLTLPISFLAIKRLIISVPFRVQTTEEQQTLASLEVINAHPFYSMTFYGNYVRLLELKKRYYWAMGIPKPHCTSFSAQSPEGHTLLAYNSDGEHRPLLLLFTSPPGGYASVSIVDIGETFGFNDKFTPFASDLDRSLLLYSPYFINTGMNEIGLAFGVMADPSGTSRIDPAKDTILASEIRRYILDQAKDVEEAIALISRYNVSYHGTTASNILIADRSGHSALIEWVDGEMKVIRNYETWQVSTNFRVYEAEDTLTAFTAEYQDSGKITGDVWGKSYWRYITAWEILKMAHGRLSIEQSMDLLSTVSLVKNDRDIFYSTQYSVVYDLDSGNVQVVLDRNYQQDFTYQLRMR